MKEFTKSVASAGIASLLLGAKQLSNVVTQPPRTGESDKATEAFNVMAQAAAGQCGDSIRESFHAIDRIQREAIDAGFRFLSLDAFNSRGFNDSISGLAQQTTDQFQRWMGRPTDCGCHNEPLNREDEHARNP
ncbi:MAG: hypothetical protein ABL921_04625 [Pirellula sp.]